jgi:hypothetical protein
VLLLTYRLDHKGGTMLFDPEETRGLCEAFELAKSTFEKTRQLNLSEQLRIACAVMDASTRLPAGDKDRLATAAILRAITEPRIGRACKHLNDRR